MSKKRKRHIRLLTFTLAPALLIAMMVIPALSLGWDEGSPPVLSNCTSCHDESTLITGKQTAWEESLHGTGDAYLRGTSKSCAGCHSGGGFSAMVAAGQAPNTVVDGDPNPTRQGCRACHQIHEDGTSSDWGLETTAAVNLYAMPGETFDGGKGNLCATCHQPRSKPPVASGGMITVSGHFGPHHGPESSLMLGTGGAGAEGSPSAHYSAVGDTCVTCHLGSNDRHTFAPEVATCKTCHPSATNLDVNGVQTAVQAKLDELKGLLVTAGLLGCEIDAEGVEECHAVAGSYPEAQANALWNWTYIAAEDGSKGVHNADYTNTLLDASIAAMYPCEAGQPSLVLGGTTPFWASYADYQLGLLSVSYEVSNTGATAANNVNITASSPTNGVTLTSAVPSLVGNIAGGGSAPVTLVYHVPNGVSSFSTMNSASAEDECGTVYTYGSALP